MRYRIRVTRVQVAERSVLGKDEEHAMDKVRTELDQPYGHCCVSRSQAEVDRFSRAGVRSRGPVRRRLRQALLR